ETVWQKLPWHEGDSESLMVAAWPEPDPEWEDPGVESLVGELQQIIGATRNLRAEYGVQPGVRVTVRVTAESPELRALLEGSGRVLADLARIEEITFSRMPGEIGASVVLGSGAELFIPLAEV